MNEVESARRALTRGLGRYPASNDSPLDPWQLAKVLGLTVSERDMGDDGRLEVDLVPPEIVVRRDAGRRRKRFTVAHEIVHFVLAAERFTASSQRAEERLCDLLAASILVPDQWLRTKYSHRVRNLSTLRHLSHEADVSLETAIIRLRETLRWTESLLTWRRRKDRWTQASICAAPYHLQEVRTVPETSNLLDTSRSSSDLRRELPLMVDGEVVKLEARLSVKGDYAIALVNLRHLPDSVASPGRTIGRPFGGKESVPDIGPHDFSMPKGSRARP